MGTNKGGNIKDGGSYLPRTKAERSAEMPRGVNLSVRMYTAYVTYLIGTEMVKVRVQGRDRREQRKAADQLIGARYKWDTVTYLMTSSKG